MFQCFPGIIFSWFSEHFQREDKCLFQKYKHKLAYRGLLRDCTKMDVQILREGAGFAGSGKYGPREGGEKRTSRPQIKKNPKTRKGSLYFR